MIHFQMFQVAQHLAKSYGDRAFAVAKMAAMTGKRWPIIGKKIHPEFPYIDAEIRWVKHSGSCNFLSFLARYLKIVEHLAHELIFQTFR